MAAGSNTFKNNWSKMLSHKLPFTFIFRYLLSFSLLYALPKGLPFSVSDSMCGIRLWKDFQLESTYDFLKVLQSDSTNHRESDVLQIPRAFTEKLLPAAVVPSAFSGDLT